MVDMNKQALDIWNAIKPMIDREIEQQTKGTVQRRKAKVTTAPSLVTKKIGVTEPFGDQYFIPYDAKVAGANVGDVVWIEYMYGASNAFASMFAKAVEDPRSCSATLSSAGWYRVMQTKDVSGTIIDFRIGRPYGANPAEAHKISFYIVGGGKSAFLDETSDTNTLCVDKIRATYGGGVMYFDVHYNASSANEVLVYFDVYGKGQANGTSIAMGLESVADAPSGETVLTTYTFAANTNGDVTSSYSITKSTGRLLTLDSAYRYGKVVHMQITAASSSTASEGSNIATGTLNGARPSARVVAAAYYDNRIAIITINTNGAITVRLSKGSMESSYTVTFGFTFICS